MSQFKDYLAKNQQQLLDELFAICALPSESAENKAMPETLAAVSKLVEQAGFQVNTVNDIESANPFLLASQPGTADRNLLMYDHYDVQPAGDPALWESHPYEPQVRDGKIFARGVADNKGNLVLRAQVIRAWLELKGELPVGIKWFIEGGEEVGSPGMKEITKSHAQFWDNCFGCIWEAGGKDEQNRWLLKMGQKGLLSMYLKVTNGNRDLHSSMAAYVESATTILTKVIASFYDQDGNIVIDGFHDNIVSPTAAEVEIMNKQDIDLNVVREFIGNPRLKPAIKDKASYMLSRYFQPTLNINGIWGGYTNNLGKTKTVLPYAAYAQVDIRLVGDQDPQHVFDVVKKHIDQLGYSGVEAEMIEVIPPAKLPYDSEIKTLLETAIKKVNGGDIAYDLISPGSGPMYFITKQFNIPTVYFGPEYPGENIHAPNENIKVSDYFETMEIFWNILEQLTLNKQ